MRVDRKSRFETDQHVGDEVNRFESYFVILDCNVVLIYISSEASQCKCSTYARWLQNF